jgi:hypothetical protein
MNGKQYMYVEGIMKGRCMHHLVTKEKIRTQSVSKRAIFLFSGSVLLSNQG